MEVLFTCQCYDTRQHGDNSSDSSVLHVFHTWQMMTNDPRSLSNLSADDYEAIELAVMETARGRWFLKEYAARNRNSDTAVLLQAIARLEGAVSGERAMEQIERVRFDLIEMAKSITGLKAELEIHDSQGEEQSRFGVATSALDGIVQTTEQATSRILSAAEQVQEIAWNLREQQFDEGVCDNIDKLATEIYTACTFQDLTAQRTQKVVRTLRFLEGRINALIDAWIGKDAGGHDAPAAAHGPADVPDAVLRLSDLSQGDVDIVIVDDPFAVAETAGAEDMPPNVQAALSMAEAVSDLDELIVDIAPPVTDQLQAAPDLDVRTAETELDQMAGDDDPIIIDDLDTLDLDFVVTDADVVEDKTAKPVSPVMDAAQPSLAQIDAMPTSAKAVIFG